MKKTLGIVLVGTLRPASPGAANELWDGFHEPLEDNPMAQARFPQREGSSR
jgi:hypothetical protein